MYAVRTEKNEDRHTDQRMEQNKHNSKENDLKRARKKGEEVGFCRNHFSALALARREKKGFVAACRRAWTNVLVKNIQ